MAATSTTRTMGFDGVSAQTTRVSFVIARFTLATSLMSTAVNLSRHAPKTSRASLIVP